jgi:hypothetical protein
MGVTQESVCGRRRFHLPPNKQVRHRPNCKVHSGVEPYACTTEHKCAPSSAGLVSPVDIASALTGFLDTSVSPTVCMRALSGTGHFFAAVATVAKYIAIKTAPSFREPYLKHRCCAITMLRIGPVAPSRASCTCTAAPPARASSGWTAPNWHRSAAFADRCTFRSSLGR